MLSLWATSKSLAQRAAGLNFPQSVNIFPRLKKIEYLRSMWRCLAQRRSLSIMDFFLFHCLSPPAPLGLERIL